MGSKMKNPEAILAEYWYGPQPKGSRSCGCDEQIYTVQKSCGDKGAAWQHSKWERSPWVLPGQAFIDFLGTLHGGKSSFTMHRFIVRDCLLEITKERMLLTASKRRRLQIQRGSGWTGYTPYLGGLAQILGSYFRDKHLLPQSRVKEF